MIRQTGGVYYSERLIKVVIARSPALAGRRACTAGVREHRDS